MPITDDRAIPESADACAEYLAEADRVYESGDSTRAWDLYFALAQSNFSAREQASRASYRLALIAVANGDQNLAYLHASNSAEVGAKELLRSLDNATPDTPPDPARVPQSVEDFDAAFDLGVKARKAGDYAEALRWFGSLVQVTTVEPEVIARAEVNLALCYQGLGDATTARSWLAKALPKLPGGGEDEDINQARALFGEIGVHARVEADPAANELVLGVEAYQLGELDKAKTAFERLIEGAVAGVTDEQRGKASFYLGSMSYQAERYADARLWLTRAAEHATDPEKAWAADMLTWRWGDTPGSP